MTYLHLTHHVAYAVHVNSKPYHVINVQVKPVFHLTTFDQEKRAKNKRQEIVLDM